MVDNVIFDLCGVLVDWRPRLALEGLFPADEIDDMFADDDHCGFMYFDDLHDRGTDYVDLLPDYENEYGPHLAAMMRAYADHVERTLTGPMPGMPQLVADLRRQGVRVWGLTNWGRDTWPIMASRLPRLIGMLDDVVVSGRDGDGAAKPDREFFDLALARFGVQRTSTLFVDDSPYNVDGATAAGLQALRFTCADETRCWLADHALL
ncbi:HAD family phosphatase [Bifidobacterium callitrichos]|uniref:HAD family phosphatase n=1 Tax=Bifidobacterium callitrichos TaxID=762209 RepID=A0A5M9Z9L7_9BIFI|nr:HAD family phosphatase [Bifidobacterium callitrichos]KAA8815184.1 HAD family phosphatase [Bifidobacterium callitrichos]